MDNKSNPTVHISLIERFQLSYALSSFIVDKILEAFDVPAEERTPERLNQMLREYPEIGNVIFTALGKKPDGETD